MALYRIDVYSNANDPQPARVAYANADTEVEAVDLVVEAMEGEMRGDLTHVKATNVETIAPGKIAWVSP